MVTIYDLLEIDERASKEEIDAAYENMIIKYQTNPTLSEKENRENEFILNKLKMAYEILINEEKRKKYDNELAKKRAEDLIKNVTFTPKQTDEINNSDNAANNQNIKTNEKTEIYDKKYDDSEDYSEGADVELTKEEQKKLREAAQKEFKMNLKKAQKAEEEYNQAYKKAYNDYIKKAGYKSGGKKLTLKKIKNTIIVIAVIILVSIIAWCIPPVRKSLLEIYNGNAIIKFFVDLIISLFKSIFGKK